MSFGLVNHQCILPKNMSVSYECSAVSLCCRCPGVLDPVLQSSWFLYRHHHIWSGLLHHIRPLLRWYCMFTLVNTDPTAGLDLNTILNCRSSADMSYILTHIRACVINFIGWFFWRLPECWIGANCMMDWNYLHAGCTTNSWGGGVDKKISHLSCCISSLSIPKHLVKISRVSQI